MKPHAFVAMPFGVKKDSQDTEIDFNRVYTELTKSGASGWLEVLRADRGDASLRQSYSHWNSRSHFLGLAVRLDDFMKIHFHLHYRPVRLTHVRNNG